MRPISPHWLWSGILAHLAAIGLGACSDSSSGGQSSTGVGGQGLTPEGGVGAVGASGGEGGDAGHGGQGGEDVSVFEDGHCSAATTEQGCKDLGVSDGTYCLWLNTYIVKDDACRLPAPTERCVARGQRDIGATVSCESIKAQCPPATDRFFVKDLDGDRVALVEWQDCVNGGLGWYDLGWSQCGADFGPEACNCICEGPETEME